MWFRIVKGVMATAYGIILFAFAPLFVAFVSMLKRNFTDMYARMKVKIYVSFLAFMVVMGFRFTVYVLLQFSHLAWLHVESIDGEIPLYISEILIALCYLKIMVSLAQKQKANQAKQQLSTAAAATNSIESFVAGRNDDLES